MKPRAKSKSEMKIRKSFACQSTQNTYNTQYNRHSIENEISCTNNLTWLSLEYPPIYAITIGNNPKLHGDREETNPRKTQVKELLM
jgi:hypothetical protein